MGIIRRIQKGIERGMTDERRRQERVRREREEYDQQHPSQTARKIGRLIQKAEPIKEPVARVAAVAASTAPKVARAAGQVASALIREPRAAHSEPRRKIEQGKRAPPTRRPASFGTGLDDSLIGAGMVRPEKSGKKMNASRERKAKPRSFLDDSLIGGGGGFDLF